MQDLIIVFYYAVIHCESIRCDKLYSVSWTYYNLFLDLSNGRSICWNMQHLSSFVSTYSICYWEDTLKFHFIYILYLFYFFKHLILYLQSSISFCLKCLGFFSLLSSIILDNEYFHYFIFPLFTYKIYMYIYLAHKYVFTYIFSHRGNIK